MCEFRPPVAAFSAGATTSASSAGPTSGTAIWRGLWAVSAARREARVRSARPMEVDAMVVLSRGSGGDGHAGAGQAEVDVVEGRLPRADRAGAQPGLADRGKRFACGDVVQRHGQRLAEDVRVRGSDPVR